MSLKVKIRADASQFDRTMSNTKKSVRGFGKSLMGIKSALAGVAVAMGAAFATRRLLAFVSSSSEAAASIEDLALQFEVLTKSSKTAKDMIAEMKTDAAKSALSLPDYAKAGKTLLAFGTGAEKIMPILKNLADVSMGNSDRFASLALAFAQTQAAGRLMGQEVLQFVNAGFNPLQQISKRTGESMIALKKRMEEGAVSSREVANAFKAATGEGGLFYKAIERGASTTKGKIAKMKNEILEIKIAFGTGFNDGLKVAADAISGGLPKLAEAATEMGDVIGKSIAEAVNGDVSRWVQIGELIGTSISAGVKIGMKQAAFSLSEGIWKHIEGMSAAGDLFGNHEGNQLGQGMDRMMGSRVSGDVNQLKKRSAESDIHDLVQSLKDGFREIKADRKLTGPVPGQPDYRYANDGEAATLMDGKRVVRILESIDRSLSKPFPN